jgi:outer membrane immunogenic protein
MRKAIFLAGFMLWMTVLCAQNPVGKGGKQLNAGLGFSNWGLPVYVGLDFGVHKDISLGGQFSIHTFNDKYKYNHTIFGFQFNGNYHFNTLMDIPSEWGFYAGLNIGFNIWNSPKDYSGPYSNGLGLGAQIGGRYFFNNNFGLNLELGGGNASTGGKFGITYKF